MFTPEDVEILEKAGSWEKIREIQTVLFPKLGALQMQANKLIYQIYGIDVNRKYKTSYSPSFPSRKNQTYNIERRGNDDTVLFGLKAKGKPSHLTRPDGKLCEMHYALLSFGIDNFQEKYKVSIDFAPYILNYSSSHREQFHKILLSRGLYNLLLDLDRKELSNFSHSCPVNELFQYDRARMSLIRSNLSEITQKNLAIIVISYAACFPFLDLWTRLSDGENIDDRGDDRSIQSSIPDYVPLFYDWCDRGLSKFLQEFHVEPIIQEDTWKSETLTRSIFEELLGVEFPKTRPTWLKSGKSRSSLELDGYCERLKLAFEYQGEYHYMEIPTHHRSRSLKDVQKNDELKLTICQDNGIDLIQVPYWEKGNREYILKALLSLNRSEINQIVDSRKK